MTLPLQGPHRGPNKQKKVQSLKNLFYSHTCGEKTKCMVRISMKPSTKIVKFMAPGSGVPALGWSQCDHILEVKMY